MVVLTKVICVLFFVGTALTSRGDETAHDFIEHVLRIPNTAGILNSVIGRLDQSRKGLFARERIMEDENSGGPSEILPEFAESLQDARERAARLLTQKHHSICHLDRRIRRLNTLEFEYRPAYYEEVRCDRSHIDDGHYTEICSSFGFYCIQWNKTIHLTRRRYSSDCWETRTMVVPVGCECMVHERGYISLDD